MSETPTPRTDACEALCPCGAKYVDSDVARNFERALTAERAARERAEAERNALRADAERWRRHMDDLRAYASAIDAARKERP